jgi:hypothetical protein
MWGNPGEERGKGAESVPSIDLSRVVWEASLSYERDVGPEMPFKTIHVLEDAVTKLIEFYNREYEAAEQKEPGSTAKWILPDCAAKGTSNVRKIEAGDVVQIRKYWAEAAERGYFTGCAFVYDGQKAALHMDISEPELIDQLRAREQKVNVPTTVGDYANISKRSQKNIKFVTLQISRYGRLKRMTRTMRRGTSRVAAWDGDVPPESK